MANNEPDNSDIELDQKDLLGPNRGTPNKKTKVGSVSTDLEIEETTKTTVTEKSGRPPIHEGNLATSPMETPIRSRGHESGADTDPSKAPAGSKNQEPVSPFEEPPAKNPEISPTNSENNDEFQDQEEGGDKFEDRQVTDNEEEEPEDSNDKEEKDQKEDEKEEEDSEKEKEEGKETEQEETEGQEPGAEDEDLGPEKASPAETEPVGGKIDEAAKTGADTAGDTGEAASKAVGRAARTGTAVAGEAAGAEAAAVEGTAAAGTAATPIGWIILAVIVVIVFLFILVFAAASCGNQSGSSVHQASDEDLALLVRADAGDSPAIAKITADSSTALQSDLQIITDETADSTVQSLSDETINILESLINLPPELDDSRAEMIDAFDSNFQEILDQLGVYIVDLPAGLTNLGQRPIAVLEIRTSERRMYFHTSTKFNKDSEEQNDIILGSAPVYFKLLSSSGDLLSKVTVKEVHDAGKGNQFADKNNYSFGRYYIELAGNPGFIIGANPNDEIISLPSGDQVAILRATNGPLRMFSKDLEALAPFIKNGTQIVFTHE